LDTITQAIDVFNSVYEFLKNIKEIYDKSKKGGWKLFSPKKTEIMEKKFREALVGTKNAIESSIWYGKGLAIQVNCGAKVDRELHFLMGLLIMRFNDIQMRIDPEKLDEKLVEHLMTQLKILEQYAQRFWNIQGISESSPDKEKDVFKIIEDFKSRLWDFQNSMEKYFRTSDEAKNEA